MAHRDLAHTHQSTEAQGAVYLMKSGLKFLSQTLASPLNSILYPHGYPVDISIYTSQYFSITHLIQNIISLSAISITTSTKQTKQNNPCSSSCLSHWVKGILPFAQVSLSLRPQVTSKSPANPMDAPSRIYSRSGCFSHLHCCTCFIYKNQAWILPLRRLPWAAPQLPEGNQNQKARHLHSPAVPALAAHQFTLESSSP